MISDIPQHDEVDFSAAVSNDMITGSSANDAWDSVETVSHPKQDVSLKDSDSPMLGSFESDKTSMEFKLQETVSPPHFAVPEGRIFLDICSGTTRPLSVAALALGCDVLSFDILLDESMDLLRDDSYEQLLRLCSSGQVGYGSASPACCHYSRLKLRPGPGPKALRTSEALQGVPGLNSADLTKVQESYLMLIEVRHMSDFGVSSWWSRSFGATTFCNELVRRLCPTVFEADFCLVYCHSCVCLWQRLVQILDVCIKFF